MKQINTFLLAFLFLSPFVLCSQSWFEGNPQWANRFISGWDSGGYEYVSVEGDTVLDGYPAKNLRRFVDRFSQNDFTNFSQVRQSGDTIWVWNSDKNQFYIHYNFSLNVGDSVAVIPNWWGNPFFPLIYVIDSIGTIDIDGQSLRFQKVNFPIGNSDYLCEGLIIEKMGMVSGRCTNINVNNTNLLWVHFFLDEECAIAVDGPCWLFCRFQNDQFTYQVSNSECDALVAISEAPTSLPLVLAPNPFQDNFIVNLPPGEKIASLRLFDISGKTVLQISDPPQTKIHAGHLMPSVYFIEILGSGKF
jgi:hypothetical protein